MKNEQSVMKINDLELLCKKLSDDVEKNEINLWIIEEENNALHAKISFLNDLIEKREKRINDLELWCGHLQQLLDEANAIVNAKKTSIILRILRKIKHMLIK